MPTKQWFEENPKVTAYISQELHQKLEKFMEDEGYKKVSQAITAILEERLSGKKQHRDDDLRHEVAQLRAKVDQHEAFMLKVIQGGLKEAFPTEETQVVSGGRYEQLILGETKPEPPEQKSKVEQSRSRKNEPQKSTPEEWMTTNEAHTEFGKGIPYETFRKLKATELKKRFNLEADPSKKVKGKTTKWIKRPTN